MNGEIIRLGASDFEEAMDFLNLVFGEHGPHDFEKLLPAYYKPAEQWMSCHYAVRERGRIRSIVGMYPSEWKVGDTILRVAGIGAVSTHPKARGAGYMKLLMSHCVGLMKEQGFHLSRLGGQRQRYQYFGYERCGLGNSFSLNPDNVRHAFHDDPGVNLVPIERSDADRLERARTLHDAQLVHCLREAANFPNYLWNWRGRPHAALDSSGGMVGYLVASGQDVSELVAENDELASRMLRAWTTARGGDVAVSLPAWRVELVRSLGRYCEGLSVRPTENWQVFDWVAVIEALFSLRGIIGELLDGTVTLGIEGYGSVRIVVEQGKGHCARGSASPDLSLDPFSAARVLFGPQPPSHVLRLPRRALPLEQWCPLPLWCSHQDGV